MVIAISGVKLMWMIVMFDLPVGTDKERKRATKFRNFLLDEGFSMSQFSVYLKFCVLLDLSSVQYDHNEFSGYQAYRRRMGWVCQFCEAGQGYSVPYSGVKQL